MAFGVKRFAGTVLAVVLASTFPVSSADLISGAFHGELIGRVSDTNNIPQMGAIVLLYDRYQHLVDRASTRIDGRFAFADLPPDTYSVNVSVPRLMPAKSSRVEVKAGFSSRLEIRMATLLSSVNVVYNVPSGSMSDDWMWTLRSSQATRPITRILPHQTSSSKLPSGPALSSTRGVLSFTGGDSTLSSGGGDDFGTGFAISTDVYGKHQLQLAGNMGQSLHTGLPVAALRATFVPRGVMNANSPEVTLSMQEVGLRPATVAAGQPPDQDIAMRALGLSIYQKADPISKLQLEYGASIDSVNYISQVVRVSPFARASYSLGQVGSLVASYSDGKAPTELLLHQGNAEGDLTTLVGAASQLPQISLRDGYLQLQRTTAFEGGFVKVAGSRTYAISGFYESVHDGRMNVAGDTSAFSPGNLLMDGSGNSFILNIGRYSRSGFIGSVDQKLNKNVSLVGVFGRMGGFTAASASMAGAPAPSSYLDLANHSMASLGVQGVVPGAGTHLSASYGWVDGNAIMPDRLFTTQRLYVSPGLNFGVRQPLPSPFGINGRFELTAELRNLLAQGYVPITSADGRTVLLVQAPRAFRGGVNFIF